MVIRRAECNGRLFPAANRRELLEAIMRTMPFASFARMMSDGERRLRFPDLNGVVSTQDLTIEQDEIDDFDIADAQNPLSSVTIQFADTGRAGIDSSYTWPIRQREGVDTPALGYIKARFGDTENKLTIQAPLIDSKYQAAYLAWCLYTASHAQDVRIDIGPVNKYADVGDIVRLKVPNRNVDIRMLVEAQTVADDMHQRIVGIRITDYMGAWPVVQRVDT